MTSPGKIQAGAAAIALTLEDDEFKKDWAQLRSGLSKITGVLSRVGAAAAAMGGAITFGFSQMVKGSADAETGFRRFALIFADNADQMTTKLRAISKETGVAMTALKTQASAFGAIFSELKEQLGPDQFTTIVAKAQKATVDLAGVAGISMQEAADRIKSALTSTGESVDQYGFNLRQAEINQELQRLGVNKNVRQLGELEKQLVKIRIIEKSIVRGQLDFANMSSTLNAKITILRSNLQELWINLSAFALAVTKIAAVALNFFVRLANWGPIGFLVKIFGALASVLGVVLLAVGSLALGLVGFASALVWTVTTVKSLAVALSGLGGMLATMNGLTIIAAFAWGKLAVAIATAAGAVQAFLISTGPLLAILALMGAATYGIYKAGRTIVSTPTIADSTISDAKKQLVQAEKDFRETGDLESMFRGDRWRNRLFELQAAAKVRATGPRPAMTQAVVGSRLISQQLAFGAGVTTPAEETAKQVSHLAHIADRVTGGEDAVRTVAAS